MTPPAMRDVAEILGVGNVTQVQDELGTCSPSAKAASQTDPRVRTMRPGVLRFGGDNRRIARVQPAAAAAVSRGISRVTAREISC